MGIDGSGLQRIKSIEFENVGFSYGGDEDILKNINFSINAGETVAVVGPTGAGKTTLINLIPRFYDSSAGRVLINMGHLEESEGHLRRLIELQPERVTAHRAYALLLNTAL